MPTTPLRERKAWQALERHYAEISGQHLRDLFRQGEFALAVLGAFAQHERLHHRAQRLRRQLRVLDLDQARDLVRHETLGQLCYNSCY